MVVVVYKQQQQRPCIYWVRLTTRAHGAAQQVIIVICNKQQEQQDAAVIHSRSQAQRKALSASSEKCEPGASRGIEVNQILRSAEYPFTHQIFE